jgi:hypothetical protein
MTPDPDPDALRKIAEAEMYQETLDLAREVVECRDAFDLRHAALARFFLASSARVKELEAAALSRLSEEIAEEVRREELRRVLPILEDVDNLLLDLEDNAVSPGSPAFKEVFLRVGEELKRSRSRPSPREPE